MDELYSFLISPHFSGWLLVLKIVFIVFGVILLIFIILGISKTTWFRTFIWSDLFEFFTYRYYGTKKLLKRWQKIKTKLESGLESEYKLAVIEADSLFDDVLKELNYPGETIEERLDKINPVILPNIEEIKEAHRVRDHIVHDPDYQLNLIETQRVILIYEKAITELGML